MIRAPSVPIEEYIIQDWCFEEGSNDDAIEIASVIRQWSISGNWLDLGCGPMLTVWPMFASGEPAICGYDRHPNIAAFHEELKLCSFDEWPIGLQRAVAFFNRKFAKLNSLPRITTAVHRIQEIKIGNLLEEQHRWHSFFNTVIQIGCFGCLDSTNDLRWALDLVFRYLRLGGRFISATWLPRSSYTESKVWGGTYLSTLSVDAFKSLVRAAGLTVCDVRLVSLDDPQYCQRYVIVAEKA